ncbi:zinc finger protein 90-like [Bradysia coprophila]|uniref:zinc finger protein 90-like n=1 Tax=Bradysia coprophila TaxID=38358 RepID=UPI00187DA755|nr:zinc finger protein 90-like [Bradysia coprophila]
MEGEQGAPDELTSLVGQNMSDLGYINFDTDTPSSNICWNVGVDITEAEQAGPCEITSQVGQNLSDLGCVNCDSGSSSSNIICNVDVESMQAEQAALSELTSQVSQSVDGLRCINFDSDTLSCNISWNFGQDIIQSERAASDELTSQVGLDLTDVLRTKLHHSMENQCKFDASLIEMEQQFQQEFDQIPAAHKKILWENTKIGTVGADTTTAISRSLQELSHRRLQYDERSFIQVISSDDGEPQARHHPEQPMHLVSLTSPPKKQIRLDWTGREGTNEVYTSESDAHTRKVLHCNQRNNSMESWADVALDVGQMGKVLLHGSTTARVESPEQSEDASQAQLIGKSIEIPHKNASKRRLNESTSYHCAECGKQFSTKDYLAIHLRIHAGEKPYKCRQCDYACVAASTLYRHERTHTAAKPFKCLICDAAFKFRSYLTRHQLTHNGEKPYECNVCNQTFLHYSTLSTHRKGHKKEESCRYESNVGGDIMEQEQATLGDLTSQVVQSQR